MKHPRPLSGLAAIVLGIALTALWWGTIWTGPKVFICLALFIGGMMAVAHIFIK